MDRYGDQQLADIGTAAKPVWSYRDMPGTGAFGIPAVTGANPSPAAYGFAVGGVMQMFVNANGQLIVGGAASAPASSKMVSFGDFFAYLGCFKSSVASTADVKSRGYRILIDGTEYAAFTADNSNIIISGGGGSTLWFIPFNTGSIIPYDDILRDIGSGANSLRTAYFLTSPATRSDSRFNTNTRTLTTTELQAWGAVSPKLFNKTSTTPPSVAFVAQDIISAFNSVGLNATNYNIISSYTVAATTYYAIRMEECLAFEAAYQRSRVLADIQMQCLGTPGASERLSLFLARFPITLAANLAGSLATALVAATASTVLSLRRIPAGSTTATEIATITFAANSRTGVFASSGAVNLATGDILTLFGPSTADSTLGDITAVIAGNR